MCVLTTKIFLDSYYWPLNIFKRSPRSFGLTHVFSRELNYTNNHLVVVTLRILSQAAELHLAL